MGRQEATGASKKPKPQKPSKKRKVDYDDDDEEEEEVIIQSEPTSNYYFCPIEGCTQIFKNTQTRGKHLYGTYINSTTQKQVQGKCVSKFYKFNNNIASRSTN
jgi:hypothetical protein